MTPITTDSAVSIAVLLAVVAAAWRLSSLLSDIRNKLEIHKDTPKTLGDIQKGQLQMGYRLTDLEEDVNNLWAFARTDDPAELFKNLRRGPRSRKHIEEENGGGGR